MSPSNAELKVDFVPLVPFTEGDYWILDVDEDYRVAVVGEPTGSTGWVLAREPSITDAEYQRALSVLRENGYDTSRIMTVPQPPAGG